MNLQFPSVPALSVVIDVVKNASRPKPVIVHRSRREAFFVSGCLDCNSEGWVMQVFSGQEAGQSLWGDKQRNEALERGLLCFFLCFAIVAFGEVLFSKLP